MAVKTSKTRKEETEDVSSLYASLAFALVVVVIGIPMWWKTTEVYRVPLPITQVEDLLSNELHHVIPVTIILCEPKVDSIQMNDILEKVSLKNTLVNEDLRISYRWFIREPMKEEKDALISSKKIEEFNQIMKKIDHMQNLTAGSVHVFVFPPEKKLFPSKFLVGKEKIIFVNFHDDLTSFVHSLVTVIKDNVVKDNILSKVFVPPTFRPREQPDKQAMRPIGALPVVDILFSLFVSQPQYNYADWDIEEAERVYLRPLVKKLLPLTEVNIRSQILYMIPLIVKAKFSNETKENMIFSEQLPLIVNPVESKLGTQVSVNPTLNFVVYIPTINQIPLGIYSKDGKRLESNAFLSPRWGGFMIYNPEQTDNYQQIKMKIDMERVMSIFISQLRLLIGQPAFVRNDIKNDVVFMEDPMGTDFEVDFFLRRRTQEQLSITISSLTSLTSLLATISNIVITDEIGNKINFAIQSVEESLKYLENADLFQAYRKAKDAFVSSEQAFFDPSLLSMLYFPNDQKYAVYIPLFLPVSLPVLMSFKQFWNYFRGIKKHVKTD